MSSFGSDCEIRGFFGVDNPQESDFRGLTKKMGVVLGNRTDDCFDTYMKNTFSIYCAEEYLQKELAFVDLDTIEKRLGGRTSIVSEFYGETFGWCRGRMIPVEWKIAPCNLLYREH